MARVVVCDVKSLNPAAPSPDVSGENFRDIRRSRHSPERSTT